MSQALIKQQSLSKPEQERQKQNKRIEYPRIVDNDNRCNICITEIAEKEERERNRRTIEALMNENFPKLMLDTKLRIQKAQRIPTRKNAAPPKYM